LIQSLFDKAAHDEIYSPGARRTRPRSVPTPLNNDSLQPPSTAHSNGERSPSVGADSRRISFADPPRPDIRRLWIPTKTDSLASGFVYDPRLNKYNVAETQWARFSDALVETAEVPGPIWTWRFYRSRVIARVRKELQYDGDLKRCLKQWNRDFKKQGFMVWLELPTQRGEQDKSDELVGETKELKDQAKRDAKRFRLVVGSNTDAGSISIYSRNSSLTRSISGEGRGAQVEPGADDLDDSNDSKG
jgi:hypothetical protein